MGRVGVALIALGVGVAGLGGLLARRRLRAVGVGLLILGCVVAVVGLLILGCVVAVVGLLIPRLLAAIGLP
jgi:hypothetical protein